MLIQHARLSCTDGTYFDPDGLFHYVDGSYCDAMGVVRNADGSLLEAVPEKVGSPGTQAKGLGA